MANAVKKVFSGGAVAGGVDQITKAQKQQQKALDAEAARLTAVEEGQKKASGGTSGGLLAFIEDQLKKVMG